MYHNFFIITYPDGTEQVLLDKREMESFKYVYDVALEKTVQDDVLFRIYHYYKIIE